MTAAQMPLTETAQFGTVREAFRDKSEALEDCAIAENHGIFDESVVISIVALQIACKAVGHMLNAAADCRVVEYVDDGAVHV